MIVTRLVQFGWLGSLTLLISCASSSSRLDGPSPKSQQGNAWIQNFDSEKIDPLYMQTQADFHYAKGEALSLEGRNLLALKEFRTALIFDNTSTTLRSRLAKEYVRLGHYGEALKEAQVVVAEKPDDLDARLLLGGLYSTLKLYEPARQQYDYVLLKNPAHQKALHYQGALLLDQGRFDEARKYFTGLAANKHFNDPHMAHFYLGKLEQVESDEKGLSRSVLALKKALSLKPDFMEAALLLAKTYEKLEDFDSAVQVYHDYQSENGPSGQMLEEMAGVLLKMGRTQESLDRYLELEQMEPMNQNARLRISFILVEQGNFQGAVDRLESVLAEIPDADKIRFYLGAVYEELKDYASARRHFELIPAESSYYAESILHISFLHKLEGQIDEAIKTLRQALPFVKEARLVLLYASYLEEQRRYDEAIAQLEKSKEEFSETPDLFYFLGSLWEQKGNPDKSINYLEAVLKIEPLHVQALNHLAYSLAERGRDLDRAEAYARQAIELQPADGYILDTLGWVLYKQGRYEDSVAYLEQAHQKVSDEAIIAEHLGDAYVKTQLPEKAMEMYAKAYESEQSIEGRHKIEKKMSQVRNSLERGLAADRVPASRSAP